jgi:hypothetical protein
MSFEAATMYLCATAYGRGNRHARWSAKAVATGYATTTVAVAGFGTSAAADRFRAAVADQVPYPVWTESLRSGIRHRYEIHQVVVSLEHAAELLKMLAHAWRRGVELFTNAQPASPSSARWRHRRDLAVAVWRGALLAGPTVRTSRGLRIRIPADLAPVVVRAARVLDVTAEVRYHPSAPIVCVPDERQARTLLSRLSLRHDPQPGAAPDPDRLAATDATG